MDFNDLKGMFAEVKTRMDAAIERVRRDMASVRTGRATVSLLDGVQVEAYGAKMPINQVATLSVPEPALIVAQPFDPSTIKELEKAIRSSDLGLNPANDGKVVRIPIPPLTEERRKELSRHVHKQAEEGRNVVRQVRRDANERLKKLLKEHKVSEDDERKGLEHVQKMTDDHVKLIDDLQKKKDQDLLGALIAEGNAHHPGGLQQVVVERHELRPAHHFPKRHGHDVGRMVRHHLPELAVQDQLHRLPSEPRRQRAIEGRRRPAALQVAQHDVPRLLAGQARRARLRSISPRRRGARRTRCAPPRGSRRCRLSAARLPPRRRC